MNLALHDIRHNVSRFVLTAVGIGLLLMIVLGMSGIYRGLIDDALVVVDVSSPSAPRRSAPRSRPGCDGATSRAA